MTEALQSTSQQEIRMPGDTIVIVEDDSSNAEVLTLLMSLETYLQTLLTFFQTARAGAVLNLPHEQDARLFYLCLHANGTWEISATAPDMLAPASVGGMSLPLVLPLSLIILVAHVETQWERSQGQTSMVALLRP